jgi:hypothetical protein
MEEVGSSNLPEPTHFVPNVVRYGSVGEERLEI